MNACCFSASSLRPMVSGLLYSRPSRCSRAMSPSGSHRRRRIRARYGRRPRASSAAKSLRSRTSTLLLASSTGARLRRRSRSASSLRARPPRRAHASAGWCRRRETTLPRPDRSSSRRQAGREHSRAAPSDAPQNRLAPRRSGRRDLQAKGSPRKSCFKDKSITRPLATHFFGLSISRGTHLFARVRQTSHETIAAIAAIPLVATRLRRNCDDLCGDGYAQEDDFDCACRSRATPGDSFHRRNLKPAGSRGQDGRSPGHGARQAGALL